MADPMRYGCEICYGIIQRDCNNGFRRPYRDFLWLGLVVVLWNRGEVDDRAIKNKNTMIN